MQLPIGALIVECDPNTFMNGGFACGFDVELQVDAFDACRLIGWGIQHEPTFREELGRNDEALSSAPEGMTTL